MEDNFAIQLSPERASDYIRPIEEAPAQELPLNEDEND